MPRMSWCMPVALAALGLVLLISTADGQDALPREPITESAPLPRPGGRAPMPPGTEPAPFPDTEPSPGTPRTIQPPHGAQPSPGAPRQPTAGSGHAKSGGGHHAPAEDVEVIYIETPPPPGCQTYWFAYLGDLVPRCGCDENCGECVMCRLKHSCGPCESGWGFCETFGEAGHGYGHGPVAYDEFAPLKQRSLLPPHYQGGPIPPSYVEALKQRGVLPGDFFPGLTTHQAADLTRRGLLPPGYRGGHISDAHIEHLKRQGMLPPNFGGHGGLSPHDYLAQLKQHRMLSPGYPNGVGVIDPEEYMEQLCRQGLIDPRGMHPGGDHISGLKRRGWLPPDYEPGRPKIYQQQYLAALARRGLLPPEYQYARRYGDRAPWQGYSSGRGPMSYAALQQRLENFEGPSLAANHQFPQFGALSVAYETNPWYFDKRDGAVYPALGYGQPLAMPLAPTVHHTYNFGWGLPVSRLTPVWRNPDQLGQ